MELQAFETFLREKPVAESTLINYMADVRRFVKWFRARNGIWDDKAATRLDVAEYRTYLQQHGGRRTKEGKTTPGQPRTVNRALISLSQYYKWAGTRDRDPVQLDPTDGIQTVKFTRLAPRWLIRREQAAFMRAVTAEQNLRDLAICGLMLHAGLRVSEVLRLTRDDLALHERSGTITVRASKHNRDRVVPANSTLRQILRGYLDTLAHADRLLFASKRGRDGRLSSDAVEKFVAQYAKQANMARCTPHMLRHTFCKNLIDAQVPIDQVAALVGHEDLESTRLYTTPSERDLQRAVDAISWE